MERHTFRRFILRQSAILIDACHCFYLIILLTPPKNSNCRLPLTLSASTTPRHSPPPRRLSSPLPPPATLSRFRRRFRRLSLLASATRSRQQVQS